MKPFTTREPEHSMKRDGNLREKIYHSIRNAISYGALSAGEQIFEKSFATKLNASRTPVREAIRQLQMEGYITCIPNTGAFVAKISITDVENIYELIELMEAHGVGRAIPRITKDGIREIRRRHRAIRAAARKKDVGAYFESNNQFHLFFARHSGNPLLESMLVSLRNKIYRTHFIGISISGHMEEYIDYDLKILGAAEQKDVATGCGAMANHIRRTRNILVNHLKTYEPANG